MAKKPTLPPLDDEPMPAVEEQEAIHEPYTEPQGVPEVTVDEKGRTTVVWRHPG